MLRKAYIYEPRNAQTLRKKHGAGQPLELGKVYKKNGYFDGTVFYAQDKATFTFLDGDEVIVLHLDATRRFLYLKGHKITDPHTHPQLEKYLGMFKDRLRGNAGTKKFVKAFEAALADLLESNRWTSNP